MFKLSSRQRDQDLLTHRMSEWMRAVTSPTPYRVGKSLTINTYRLAQCGVIMLLLLTAIVLLIPVLFLPKQETNLHRYQAAPAYNDSYPLSPVVRSSSGSLSFRIAAVSDLDTNSKAGANLWKSHLKLGKLTVSEDFHTVSVNWEDDIVLKSDVAQKGRGMELSELVVFNGKLYTCDDRTGIVFEITSDWKVLPFVVLNDGDGQQIKGFKCEWMTVRDDVLWVGGLGKEWTSTVGVVENLNPQWVKSVGHLGDVQHHDWVDKYNALREKAGFMPPGYMIHESGMWSHVHKRWFFLPRRASRETYTEADDERRATNLLFTADETFTDVTVHNVGKLHITHGFSSFKFVPGSDDKLIVALKSEEDGPKIASYIMAFRVDTLQVVLDETHVGDFKFEGIEFV